MIEARPHPTLAPGSTDFIDGGEFTAFITDRSAKIIDEKINFTVCFKCNVSSVNGYLKKGKLSYGLRVKCMGTVTVILYNQEMIHSMWKFLQIMWMVTWSYLL